MTIIGVSVYIRSSVRMNTRSSVGMYTRGGRRRVRTGAGVRRVCPGLTPGTGSRHVEQRGFQRRHTSRDGVIDAGCDGQGQMEGRQRARSMQQRRKVQLRARRSGPRYTRCSPRPQQGNIAKCHPDAHLSCCAPISTRIGQAVRPDPPTPHRAAVPHRHSSREGAATDLPTNNHTRA